MSIPETAVGRSSLMSALPTLVHGGGEGVVLDVGELPLLVVVAVTDPELAVAGELALLLMLASPPSPPLSLAGSSITESLAGLVLLDTGTDSFRSSN